ncbi:Origin recognition complex subunit 3 [Neolecta irregularis DAH-3]|uniref:Origin recognition complex subunit 3 n=1 Tax=Neolecta irregularis (strain DAH-3) TaxID=1198029 RepID=A0A1U7LNA2_NEOID|nr:Origin recognition complex subunit 3 [Neolecta irregularis DAH-3]|eukprot:OLL24135.1 Origin recognition complex subunit 3 [Neolecta irregularis DAH-3]
MEWQRGKFDIGITGKFDIKSVSDFQFAAMSHFWGNPLCILLSSPIDTSIITPDHCQAIRNLVSFKEFVERKLAETDIGEAKALLNDDDYLRELVVQFADMLKQYHQHLKFALEILLVLQSCLVSVKQINILKIYENILTENAEKHINSILLSLKHEIKMIILTSRKISSSNLQNFLEQAINLLPKQHHWSTHLEELLDSLPSEKVLSEHQIRQESKSETTRATNNSQKASFSTNKDTMSKHDITYTKLVNSVHAYLKEFIFVHLHAPFDLPLYEAFYYNNLKPLQAVFQPKYRQNIQNALVHPEFYLGELDLKKQPSSAVLFQRYLETGALINIFDWWTSFQTVFKDEEGQVGEEQELIQAKFMNSMEELRYLGFIKSTKRKTDHVCRMVWGNV